MTEQRPDAPSSSPEQHGYDVLAAIMRNAEDRTSLSDDLHLAAGSAPERLHLDRGRANALRALNLPPGATVLEVGAQAGALTRYLGEYVRAVDAFDSDPILATIAADRTADLANVAVYNTSLFETTARPSYDLAVIGGVHSDSPDHALLDAVRRRLVPGGALCLTGANSMSAGWFGRSPGYGARKGTSRHGWEDAVRAAGFRLDRVLGCLPAHEVARVVFDDELATRYPRLLAELPRMSAADQRRWAELTDAHLAGQFAPSFLVLATNASADSARAHQLWPDDQLACYFNTDRAMGWCTRARVTHGTAGPAIHHAPLAPEPASASEVTVRSFTDQIYPAPTMVGLLLEQPWLSEDLLTAWYARLPGWEAEVGPALWDLIPANVLVTGSSNYTQHPIDLEWTVPGATADVVVRRGLLLLADQLAAQGWAGAAPGSTVEELAAWLGAMLGLPLDFIPAAIEWESWFQAVCRCGTTEGAGFARELAAMRAAWRHRLAEPIAPAARPEETGMPIGSELDTAVDDVMPRINRMISDGDTMYRGSTRHYFHAAKDALRACLQGLHAAGRPAPQRVLDFGCGHGRVLRALHAAFSEATLFACDVDSGGVEYCADTFGAVGFTAPTDLNALEPVNDIDLIWSGSVLTHLGAGDWSALLRYFARALGPGGLAVLTMHGRRVAWRMEHGQQYGLAAESADRVLRDYRKHGFGYADYPGQRGYGISLSDLGWVTARVAECPGMRIAGYTEAGWDRHQDVLVLCKDADETVRGQ